jgi:hypothetical protein
LVTTGDLIGEVERLKKAEEVSAKSESFSVVVFESNIIRGVDTVKNETRVNIGAGGGVVRVVATRLDVGAILERPE